MFFEFISGNNLKYTLQKVVNMLAILYIMVVLQLLCWL
jgi:hypothetical protein